MRLRLWTVLRVGKMMTRSINLGSDLTKDVVGCTLRDIRAGIDEGCRTWDVGVVDRVWTGFLSRGLEGGSSWKLNKGGEAARGFSQGAIVRW